MIRIWEEGLYRCARNFALESMYNAVQTFIHKYIHMSRAKT